jgi:VIT1/CCC1 family predicted Fe2+/Mn2+ transporter
MSTKKIIPVLMMAFAISFVTPTFAAHTTPAKTEVPKEVRVQQIKNRLVEIRNMDMSTLSKAEKKELRKEVKSLRKEAASQGVYLSVGAIIIIILLLILIL